MKKNAPNYAILALPILLATSCATIIDGPKQDIPVTTIPPGATVIQETRQEDSQNEPDKTTDRGGNEKTSTLTPATLTLERKREYLLTITKEGYKTETIKIEQVINGASAGNLIGLTMLGTAIDTASGAQWDLAPENIVVSLQPLTPEEQNEVANKLNTTSLQNKLQALSTLKDANLLTENQYLVLRDITINSESPSVDEIAKS